MMVILDAYESVQCDGINVISWQKVAMDYQDGSDWICGHLHPWSTTMVHLTQTDQHGTNWQAPPEWNEWKKRNMLYICVQVHTDIGSCDNIYTLTLS